MELFKVSPDGRVTVSPEIRLIKAFATLLKRYEVKDTNIIGYVYHMADYRSPYAIYPEDERKEKLRHDMDLPVGWRIPLAVTRAIEKYQELTETETIRSLRLVKKSLQTSGAVVENLRTTIENTLQNPDEEMDLDATLKRVNTLITLSEKLPKVIANIQSLEEAAKKESKGNSKIRGGGQKGAFEE